MLSSAGRSKRAVLRSRGRRGKDRERQEDQEDAPHVPDYNTYAHDTAPGPHLCTRIPERMMAVDKELLEILACPHCKTKVELVKNGTALKCSQCNRVYPIKDDIPVMLLDEATIEP